jgi:glycosyltransferase involved in cell wall biosynthesis
VTVAVKIVFLCPHLRIAGGVRAVLAYADRLAGRGHDVRVLVPGRPGWHRWRRRWPGSPPEWMPRLRAAVERVRRWEPARLPDADAVIATAWQSAPAAAAAPARCGRGFYLIQHYESLYHGEPGRVDATYELPLEKIVISTWLEGIMRDRFRARATVIVTPVDPVLFHPVPGNPDDGTVRALMLHHEYAWKGVADGLEAVAQVRARHPALQLVGFGVKAPRGPSPYDEFHENPPQERLAWLYSRCPIYLCPSWDEGLGMPGMEALACGAALVTYDNGGCRDYAVDGLTALVAPRRDVAALAKALGRAVEDRALRQRLARAGRALVTQQFDWDRAAERLEAALAGRTPSLAPRRPGEPS